MEPQELLTCLKWSHLVLGRGSPGSGMSVAVNGIIASIPYGRAKIGPSSI